MQLLLDRIVLLLARQTVLLLLLLDMLRFYVLPLRWRVLPISVPPSPANYLRLKIYF